MDKKLLQAIAEVTTIRNKYRMQFPERVAQTAKYFLDFWDTVHYNDWLQQRKK